MDALMAGFVAAILAHLGDQAALLAAVLADRRRSRWPVVLGAALAFGASYAIGSAGGALLAPHMTPEARQLLLALALVLAGGAALLAPTLKDRLAGWRIGGFATAALGLFIMAFGDRTQFVVAALATRTAPPALAAIGATLGALAVITAAAMLGEAGWRRLPLAALRLSGGALLALAGVMLGLDAVSLV